MAAILAGVAATGFLVGGSGVSIVSQRALLRMQIERLPGEGDPFNDGVMRRSEDIATPCPTGLTDSSIKPAYIETEDEPWHATCRAATVISKSSLETAWSSSLPFAEPEYALDDALMKATNPSEVDEAIAACLAAGGRAGCPTIVAAEKLKKNMLKDPEKKVAFKSLKPAVGGLTPGFKNQGEGRALAKTHDNSV